MILSWALQGPLTQHPDLMAQTDPLEEFGAWNKQCDLSQSERHSQAKPGQDL